MEVLKTVILIDDDDSVVGLENVILPACDGHERAKANVTQSVGGSLASVTWIETAKDAGFHGIVIENESLCTIWMTDDGRRVYVTEMVISCKT